MTSRRSIQRYEQQLSRAFQFIPGHVGGRVASAQPIRRRGGTLRRPSVGSVLDVLPEEPTPGTPPIGARVRTSDHYLHIDPDATSVLAFCTHRSGVGIIPPTGWTVLLEGYGGTDLFSWAILSLDNPSVEEETLVSYEWSSYPNHSKFESGETYDINFVGGEGGSWVITAGPTFDITGPGFSPNGAGTFTVPPAGRPYALVVFCASIGWFGNWYLPAGYGLFSGPAATAIARLGGGDYFDTDYEDAFMGDPPGAVTFGYDSGPAGSIGWPSSRSYAVTWSST